MRSTRRFRTSLGACLAAFLMLTFLAAYARGRSSGPALGQGQFSSEKLQERSRSARNLHQAPDAATLQKLQAAFHQLPLSFIPNQGQLDERVRFYGRSGSASFFFARDEVVYTFIRWEKEISLRKVSRSAPPEDSNSQEEGKGRGHVVRLRFVGANPDPVIEGLEELPGKVNYFIGHDPARWRRGIPTFGQICYRELWPGIDLIYRGEGGQLKYEFIVKPGADPKQIRLAYRGIEGMRVNDGGDLILKTVSGELRDRQPYAYQEIGGRRVEVEANFQIKGRDAHRADTAHPGLVHGFEVRGYDPAYLLILDPGLDYATFLGGSREDRSVGIALDAEGNAYVTGKTTSSDLPTTTGAFDTDYNGSDRGMVTNGQDFMGGDAFVAKLSPDGSTLLYATFLGGSSVDEGSGIVLDSAGNAYVTGVTSSPDFPTTAGAFDTNYNGSNILRSEVSEDLTVGGDAFAAKLSADGSTLLYATFLGGSGGDSGRGIVLDNAGNAYVTGETSSFDFPTTAEAFQLIHNGFFDAFVAKLSSDGSTLLYATFLGGNSGDTGRGIALDRAGNAFVTGETFSSDFPATAEAFQLIHNGSSDAFVAKLSADGSILLYYATFLGGNSGDSGRGIALDGAGNAFVTGETSSFDFPTTVRAFNRRLSGFIDAFVAKLSADGSALLHATFLGGSSRDRGFGIALDDAGNAYVTGETSSFDFPTTAGAFDTTCGTDGHCDDAFVAKLSADGSALLHATFLGGSSRDRGFGIALDDAGNAYVTGETSSFDFPITAGAFDTSYNGGTVGDAFITKVPIIDIPTPPTADLALAMTVSPSGPVTVGNSLTYTVTVTNNGPAPTSGVTLTSSLSSELNPLGVSGGRGSSCRIVNLSTVTCALGVMGGGASATITIDGRSATVGTITNTATVTGRPTDPEMANNTAMAAVVVEPGPLTIGAPALLEGELSNSFSPVNFFAPLEINGGAPPYRARLVEGALPSGLFLFGEGISGNLLKAGSRSFTVEVTDGAGSSVSKSFTINIFRALKITTRRLPKGKVGKRYRAILKATGGKKPYTWSVLLGSPRFNLPEGLSLNSSTGEITGTPTTSGNFGLLFQVTSSLRGLDLRPIGLDLRPIIIVIRP